MRKNMNAKIREKEQKLGQNGEKKWKIKKRRKYAHE
jgi:hypothetical protein